ncbi:MAG: discoidin domain-containing protein [Kiritimatiellae bacterium]|nr:discoidin domain-containing protein [Kiritimatiellia bacterium]
MARQETFWGTGAKAERVSPFYRQLITLAAGLGLLLGARADDVLTEGWRFSKDPTRKLEAAGVDFDDSQWEAVRVPHDWAISGPFNQKEDGGSGKLPWRGVGWYRRAFTLDAADRGKSVFLDFDGVMASPKVYVNGQLAGGWNYGYLGFRVDATPFVKFGERNIIAVRASTLDHGSRWYPGAGIYRKVVLRIRNRAHFAYHGIQITTPEVEEARATVAVKWELENAPEEASVAVTIMRNGKPVTSASAYAAAAQLNLTVGKPARWDVDSPNLYTAVVSLRSASDETLTEERIRFGIRTIAFPVASGDLANDWAANGFHLNGRRVQFKGVDLHADLGLLGMAFNTSAMRRQLTVMKEMGVNALRTSHNPPAPEVLDLCDEMGIVVWDECFDKWDATAGRRNDENLEAYVTRNLQAFVKRDRNHPSVVIWSMSNEIGEGDPKNPKNNGLTRARCAAFREKMRELDTTRPIGNGNIYFMSYQKVLDKGIYEDLDITGWNYGACYRSVKAKYPDKPIVYSESASAFSSYGFYLNPPPDGKHHYGNDQFQVDSYDHNAGPDIPDVEFDYMERDRYVCGEFVWTGIDYLGEPTPFSRESRSSYFGIVDLTGVPKDRYYLYRSYWNTKDETVHILPHWNWEGREGKRIPVYVYTSGDRAELFLNGRSLGIREKGENPFAKFPNLLAGAVITASSSETDKGNVEAGAVDGNAETRWCASTGHLPEWLQFDLGEFRTFSTVTVDFEFPYEKYAYMLQVSPDGTAWVTVFSKKMNGTERPIFEKPVFARYVRVVVTDADGKFASIREMYVGEPRLEIPPFSAYYNVCGKYRLRWFDVPYEPGELKAVAYRGEKRIGEAVMKTAGPPAALKLTVEPRLADDPDTLVWVQVDALDAAGVRNPLAMNRVRFRLEGPGTILGVGNGNPHAFEPFTDTASHPLFFGKGMAVIRRHAPGALSLTVESDGLAPARAAIW